jgi:hypothetical protein
MPAKFALIGYDAAGKPTLLRGPDSNYTAQVNGWVDIRLGRTRPENIALVENWQSDRGVIALADLDQIARNNGLSPDPTLKEVRRLKKVLP